MWDNYHTFARAGTSNRSKEEEYEPGRMPLTGGELSSPFGASLKDNPPKTCQRCGEKFCAVCKTLRLTSSPHFWAGRDVHSAKLRSAKEKMHTIEVWQQPSTVGGLSNQFSSWESAWLFHTSSYSWKKGTHLQWSVMIILSLLKNKHKGGLKGSTEQRNLSFHRQ